MQDYTHLTVPFKIEAMALDNSCFIDFSGRVGLGTHMPSVGLHIKRTDGKAAVLIEEMSSAKKKRVLCNFKNNGPSIIKYLNTDSGVKWVVGPNAGDHFTIDRVGPGVDLTVLKTGDVKVRRNLICKTVKQTSARATKENFEPVNKDEILEKLSQLEVESWNYKGDASERHIGPMAEDFNKAFRGASSTKYIIVGDATGALIASVQSLKEKNDTQAQHISAQDKLIDTLAARLSALEATLK